MEYNKLLINRSRNFTKPVYKIQKYYEQILKPKWKFSFLHVTV